MQRIWKLPATCQNLGETRIGRNMFLSTNQEARRGKTWGWSPNRVIPWSTFNAKLTSLEYRWQGDISRLYTEVWWCYSPRSSINLFWVNIGHMPTVGQMTPTLECYSPAGDVGAQLQCRGEWSVVWARSPPWQYGGWLGGRHRGSGERSVGGLIFQFGQEMMNYQPREGTVFPETVNTPYVVNIKGRAYLESSLLLQCSISHLLSENGCSLPHRLPESSWETSVWMNLENSIWLHPESFTCWFSGTTHWDTLQENLTENRWQKSWGLTQLRRQGSKPKPNALGPEFLEQTKKWCPPLSLLTVRAAGYWPPVGATMVSVTQRMGWCLDWWVNCPASLHSVPSLWIFFELITTAQNEHAKFRPKLFHVSKGTVNYFVNVHTTQPAKFAWWSLLLHLMSEGTS